MLLSVQGGDGVEHVEVNRPGDCSLYKPPQRASATSDPQQLDSRHTNTHHADSDHLHLQAVSQIILHGIRARAFSQQDRL